MNKQLVSLSLLVAASMVSLPTSAATNSISKTAAAKMFTVLSDGRGMPAITFFILSPSNFSSATVNKPNTLSSVAYSIAAYPVSLTDTVQLCYYRPYTAAPSLCRGVTSGSTSATPDFNSLPSITEQE
ncbi:hypothetical protein SSYM_0464 [Serratia symbiotica str. Tucson]|uniref:Uncharacterized protein n=2 Tax=Serratia symbiotica TaxID=138074 RepID=E9CKB6_9GAMM|nr:hypothetical protein [Serratia symbiotica]EFW13028.1 hypothetical protein SSYM_0464 [Serratia symbiotica str. Tucson]BBI92927.1 uncharacterized protein SSYIS1_28700 [Serratia symbiotica]